MLETRLLRKEVAALVDVLHANVRAAELTQLNQQVAAVRALLEGRYGASLMVNSDGDVCYELDMEFGALDARSRNVEDVQRTLNRGYGAEQRAVKDWRVEWGTMKEIGRGVKAGKVRMEKEILAKELAKAEKTAGEKEKDKGKGKGKATRDDEEDWDAKLARDMQKAELMEDDDEDVEMEEEEEEEV